MKEVEILTRSQSPLALPQTGARRRFPLLLGVKGVLDRGPILVDAIQRLTGESGSATNEIASQSTRTRGTKKTQP
jgi:hypothetical protein